MNNLFRAPVRTFVAGLLAVLPVALTVAVIVWVASVIDQFIGPHSAVGRLLVSIGLTVVETKIAAYLIGIVFVLIRYLCARAFGASRPAETVAGFR